MTIAVVIPCYKVKKHILSVLSGIGPEVALICVVDDKCPEGTGRYVQEHCNDPRVKVIYHSQNKGVGGATITGYRQALENDATVVVKIDGDGQMDTSLLSRFVNPILNGVADYTKGNRFFDMEYLRTMPFMRVVGNSVLSLANKISSGYWETMDPTNGYTAIHKNVLKQLPLAKIDEGYFFESDMLFHLNIIRAVVKDIPVMSRYGDENSNLSIMRVVLNFPKKYMLRFIKRMFYTYFLRDFNAGSVELVVGSILMLAGAAHGGWHWYTAYEAGVPATSGVVMLSALPILLGFQLLVSAINYDISHVPKSCIHESYETMNELRPTGL